MHKETYLIDVNRPEQQIIQQIPCLLSYIKIQSVNIEGQVDHHSRLK